MRAVVCNLCGCDDWRLRYPAVGPRTGELECDAFRCTCNDYGAHGRIVECRRCGYVYANPRPDAAELGALYAAVQDETYVQERAGRERTFERHLRSLEAFTGPGAGRSLLDVGAYTGVFVAVAGRAGWQAWGLEPSRWAAEVAQEQGLAVLPGSLETADLNGRRFAAVTLWDVIEHLDDPAAGLNRAYQLLQPGGVLAVHTMDISSPTARLLGARWPWLMQMHLHYFSGRTLAEMVRRHGFELLGLRPQGRYLSLRYLVSRLRPYSAPAGRALAGLVARAGLEDVAVPVNFGDLITAFASRPAGRDPG
ncbi:MAG: class I SAM-dependent methyltransferase [Candidatus Promineifilaceae bacterium]